MSVLRPLYLETAGDEGVGLREFADGDQLSAALIAGLSGTNRIINPNLDYWQRGSNFTSSAGIVDTADRFFIYAASCTITATRQAWGVSPYAQGGPDRAKYFIRCALSGITGSSQALLSQTIEDVETFAGRTITISFWARASVAGNKVGVRVIQNFGSGGSAAESREAGTIATVAGLFARYSVTVDVPPTTGKIVGNNSNLQIVWDFAQPSSVYGGELVGQTGYFDIGGLDVEEGEVMTPFFVRPLPIELMLCQYYLEKSYPVDTEPGSVGTVGAVVVYATSVGSGLHAAGTSVQFKITKRGTPAVTSYSTSSGAAARVRDALNNVDLNASFANTGPSGFFNSATQTSSSSGWNMQFHWVADAELRP